MTIRCDASPGPWVTLGTKVREAVETSRVQSADVICQLCRQSLRLRTGERAAGVRGALRRATEDTSGPQGGRDNKAPRVGHDP